MRLVNTFIIALYGVMNYSLLMPNLLVFYAKLKEKEKNEFDFALEVAFSIIIQQFVLLYEIIHSLKLVDYLLVHADKPWYNYNQIYRRK